MNIGSLILTTLQNLVIAMNGFNKALSDYFTSHPAVPAADAYTVEAAASGTHFSNIALAGSPPASGDYIVTVTSGGVDQRVTYAQAFGSPPPIGNTTANSGAFTSLSCTQPPTLNGTIIFANGGVFNLNQFVGTGIGSLDPGTVGNFAFGANALNALTTGRFNVGLGLDALGSVNSGNYNIGVGDNAGVGCSAGTNNIFIYTEVQGTLPTFPAGLTNAIVIGQNLGNVTEAALINGCIILADGAGNIRLDYGQTAASQWTFPVPINMTEVAAPASPAAGFGVTYFDSTNHIFSSKNSSGTITNTVVPSTAGTHQFATGISAAGVISYAQPAYSDLSGAGAAGTVLNASTFTATPTLGASGTLGSVTFGNNTSGLLTLQAVAGVALGTVTVSLPAKTDTLVGKTTTDTFTNKTYDTAGTGNVFQVAGTTVTGLQGSGGSLVMANTPTLTTPVIGAATGTSTSLTGVVYAFNATAIPAGGTAGTGYKFSSTTNFGVFFGSGVPTLAAAQGSLYIRSNGSNTSTRAYVNTNGSTTWTPIITVA